MEAPMRMPSLASELRAAMNQDPKDEESPTEYVRGGYLPVSFGDSFCDGKYVVVRKLGWGHFSTVWLVRNTELDTHAALKIVKSAQHYTETARDEIRLLRQIHTTRPAHPAHRHLVSLLDAFDHPSTGGGVHVCMAMEPLGESLLALIELYRAVGVPSNLVKSITSQVLTGLAFLHDYCDLAHTDIKPENILISIPNVEEHIRSQLLATPHRSSRYAAAAHRARMASSHNRSGERIRILASQPISSPPSSFSRSPLAERMAAAGKAGASSPSSPSSSHSNSLVTSFATMNFSTAPTSLQSDTLKTAMQRIPTAEQSLSEQLISRIVSSKPPSGPSLLSQTAPCITPTIAEGTMAERASDELEQLRMLAQRVAATPASRIPDQFSPTSPPSGTVLSPPHISVMPHIDDSSGIQVKIADMGNATSSRFHFTDNIQTRQYRAPEVIIGRSDWNTKVDMWSVACLVFELVTGDMLFEPQSRHRQFSKDDDHVAMITELLGDRDAFDEEFRRGGKKSRILFNSHGEPRAIKDLNRWPIHRVLSEKYKRPMREAEVLAEFLLPMLSINPFRRASAASMLAHHWLL